MKDENKFKILLVDDDESVIQILQRFLANPKYELFSSYTLEEGIEKAKAILPHVILLDINLNESSGFKFLDFKRNHFALKNTQVLMMSSDAFTRNIKNAMALGATDFIVKPLINVIVTRKVKKALLGRSKNVIEIAENKNIPSNCIVICHPLKRSVNKVIIDSYVKFSENDIVKLDSEGRKKSYKKIGKSSRVVSGMDRSILSSMGDDIKVKDEFSSLDTHQEEDFLLSFQPKIFILDDDTNFTELMKSFFSKFKLNISVFHEIEGLKKELKSSRPDIFLIDLSIKELNDSFELITYINENLPEVPMLITTSNTDGISTAHGVELGAADFLYKPIKRNALVHKVSTILAKNEATTMYDLSKATAHLKDDYLCLDSTILRLDDLGIYFSIKSFIPKGVTIKLQCSDITAGSDELYVDLLITSVNHDKEKACYQVYGEYINLQIEQITQLIGNFVKL